MNLWTSDLPTLRPTTVDGGLCMRFEIFGRLSGSRLTAGSLR